MPSRASWTRPSRSLSEALVGCRKSLDRNHETTIAALAGLASIYAQRRDMKQLGRALIESAEIARAPVGARARYDGPGQPGRRDVLSRPGRVSQGRTVHPR